jgi:hypothetical protein
MSAVEILRAVRDAGVSIAVDGNDLVLKVFADPPPALLSSLKRHKADIVALLRPTKDGWTAEDWQAFYDERAGILQFDVGLPRPAAEAQAFEACIIEWLNRNPVASPAGRCLWCGRCERPSDAVLPFGTQPGTHAWLHGECWRPWQQARRAEAVKTLSRIGSLSDMAQREQK